jgi:cell division protein FtsB
MRLLLLVLFLLACLIQYPLWMGKGGWFKVWDMQKQVAKQRETNDSMRARNAALDAEVKSLASGTEAIEEHARGELGMMRDGEVFVNILPPGAPIPNASAAPTKVSTPVRKAPGANPAPAQQRR